MQISRKKVFTADIIEFTTQPSGQTNERVKTQKTVMIKFDNKYVPIWYIKNFVSYSYLKGLATNADSDKRFLTLCKPKNVSNGFYLKNLSPVFIDVGSVSIPNLWKMHNNFVKKVDPTLDIDFENDI